MELYSIAQVFLEHLLCARQLSFQKSPECAQWTRSMLTAPSTKPQLEPGGPSQAGGWALPAGTTAGGLVESLWPEPKPCWGWDVSMCDHMGM